MESKRYSVFCVEKDVRLGEEAVPKI
jgi:hypothetical protein